MNSFTDYYALLGVPTNAPANTVKAAFKKLALQYHPDVYKGADAEERMRVLLLAYQTLSDPAARKVYDVRHADHSSDASLPRVRVATQDVPSGQSRKKEVSPTARRDRQRHYAFPDLSDGYSAVIDLGDITHQLSPEEARTLKEEGLLRGLASEAIETNASAPHHCHRCHHRWVPAMERNPIERNTLESRCPSCKATDWGEYLLLRCVHCRAVFESEQIRDEVFGDGRLCPPYELFPLCPQCAAARWCPTEDDRVAVLHAQLLRRNAWLRVLWFCIGIIMLVLVIFLFTTVH